MAVINKTKSQTYNFLIENKNIEDIKQQENIEVIEKRRHGGKTYKLIEVNNTNWNGNRKCLVICVTYKNNYV